MSTLALLAVLLAAAPAVAQEAVMVPILVDGADVRLEMRIYKPTSPGPRPTLVFNHGSTGRGTDPTRFRRPIDFPALATFFSERGWAVVIPARRGRASSEGQYDEGFRLPRSEGYTCEERSAMAGAERALRDIGAAMQAIVAMPFVDSRRVVMGGHSRGGALSAAYAGRRPEQVRGVINFVGGWLGIGCDTASVVNRTLFTDGARYPGEMLWLYGDQDPFYPLAHSRENFAAFRKAGGMGAFHALVPKRAKAGHGIVAQPNLWADAVNAYLERVGFRPGGEVSRSP